MMNGYSVTEAASVLGVPTERVWELLARGVLAGAPEGETGMRVFLQPRQAPAQVNAVSEEDPAASRTNGPDREMSPFRELLTEFRNLTERYGQALLALGESRGEVASLRSRVDLLEARIDLRLPMGPPAAAPWPTQPPPVAEPLGAGAHAEGSAEPDAEGEHRRRRRRGRRATESFAEALARAEDPSPADLPEAGTRADAEIEDVDRSLPRDVMPAEHVLVADEAVVETQSIAAATVEAEEPTDVGKPAFAEPDAIAFGQPEATAPEPSSPAAETEFVSAGLLDEGEEGWDQAVAEAVDSDEPAPAAEASQPDLAGEPEPWRWTPTDEAPAVAGFDEPDALEAQTEWTYEPQEPVLEVERIEVEPLPVPEVAEAEPASDAASVPVDPEPAESIDVPGTLDEPTAEAEPAADFDADRYTSVIEQPDWFEAEVDDEPPRAPAGDETAADVAESMSQPDAAAEAESAPEAAADGWPEVDGAPVPPDQPASPSDAPADIGADEMEVASGGIAAPAHAEDEPAHAEDEPEAAEDEPAHAEDEPEAAGLPGSRELDEALEAFGTPRPQEEPSAPDEEWPPAPGGAARFTASGQRAAGYGTDAPRPTYGTVAPNSPATRAYRRLRRIFPT